MPTRSAPRPPRWHRPSKPPGLATIDAADAVTKGLKPEALRARVLADSPPALDAAGIIATAPAAAAAKKTALIAAAQRSHDAKR